MFGPQVSITESIEDHTIELPDVVPDYGSPFQTVNEGEAPVDYESVDQDAKIFSLREVAVICATMEDILKFEYEKTKTVRASKPQGKAAPSSRSGRKSKNPRRKNAGGARQ